MILNFRLLVLVASAFLFTQKTIAQTNAEQAVAKGTEAIKLEDKEGKYDEAIKLFEEAEKLDPQNITYPYEKAYAYTAKKDYKKAIDVLEKLLKHKDVYGSVYQALGNAYDYEGKPDKAINVYEKGIKKFPNAGELYLELGNMKMQTKEYNIAITYYEKGIEMDPAFPSNYYWATKLFLSSEEEVWGMIYGEIFVNLERNSQRTQEISKMLFDTYKSEIKFTSDTSYSVSFSKSAIINLTIDNLNNFKLPFGTGFYEMTTMMALLNEKNIDINSLDRMRTRFIDAYLKGSNKETYPNVLFDYQAKAKDAGQFEAYNHWLLMKGDEEGFTVWQLKNTEKWDGFLKWFSENRLMLDASHKFYRAQY